MRERYDTPLFYLPMTLVCQFAALANFLNGYVPEAVVLSITGSWLVVLAGAALWDMKEPGAIGVRMKLYLGDTTIVVLSILGLGLVGIERQLQSPASLLFYAGLVAYIIYKRHQPDYQAWDALSLKW